MGGALVKGWTKAGMAANLAVTAHTQRTLDRLTEACPGISVTLDNNEAASGADVVVLAVKPWLIQQVIEEIMPVLKDKLVVSVAAGVRHERIDVYVMPNIAAEYGQSMTFVEEAPQATAVAELFGRVGQCRVVPQRLMDAGMMMAGCGIAYVMRFLRAMMEGGVEMGFYPDEAKQIAMQTMQGAVALLREPCWACPWEEPPCWACPWLPAPPSTTLIWTDLEEIWSPLTVALAGAKVKVPVFLAWRM